jgi:hypothetical protein
VRRAKISNLLKLAGISREWKVGRVNTRRRDGCRIAVGLFHYGIVAIREVLQRSTAVITYLQPSGDNLLARWYLTALRRTRIMASWLVLKHCGA